MLNNIRHFLYCPMTGLGLHGGSRGNIWLQNRIKIFKQFVIPSLKNQTNKDFILWVSWRWEDRRNLLVKELKLYLENIIEFQTVFTYSGVCFWDDKYPDEIACDRLLTSLHGSIGELLNVAREADYVLMTIQPSDDCYHRNAILGIQKIFECQPHLQAIGFRKGYIMDYLTKELAEYNPLTIPPFFTIKFPIKIFKDPFRHAEYSGPYKSHEYIAEKLKWGEIGERGFLVGTHGENISTVFNHPFKGRVIEGEEKSKVLKDFNLYNTNCLKLEFSPKNWILKKMPNIRTKIYNWLRN